MKILITGANGYIGNSLYNALKDKYDVTTITRKDFDLVNIQSMIEFFKGKYFDVVMHCAITGGGRLKEDSWEVMNINLCMHYNLIQCRSHYNKLISFGSGAEIYNNEKPYGFSKKVIAQSISNISNFYNIRIYGVFDENELETRFIKANITRYIKHKPIEIYENKSMDIFYMKDLILLIKHYIETSNENLPKEIDCTYPETLTLLEISEFINQLDDHKVEINIIENTKEYCGKYNDIGLKYIGLKQGIIEVYNKLK
jgi:nucleoside-diphosphate-sugar epimerase